MGDLKVEVDPGDVGLDPARLARIEEYFRTYVDDGRLPGWLVVVARHGKVAYLARHGMRDLAAQRPVELDTIWRIYSMTKPVTSLALMMLYEEGAFDLRDPVEEFVPSFANGTVFTGGSADRPQTVPVTGPVRLWHLLTHTAGLSYDGGDHPVDELYRRAGEPLGDGGTLAQWVDVWGSQPLLFEPGTRWNYSRATDVLGRVVEVVAGRPFEEFLAERIFEPLGMTDTSFVVPEERVDRLASLYVPDAESRRAVPAAEPRSRQITSWPSGGGGLFSTAGDYHRFCQLLAGGGELDGVRLVGPRTVAMMASNHLAGGRSRAELSFGDSEQPDGVGFGLGFSVMLDPARTKTAGSVGEYGWGGAASTEFWVDPQERLTAMFLTQLVPSGTWPLGPRLRQLVQQSILGRT